MAIIEASCLPIIDDSCTAQALSFLRQYLKQTSGCRDPNGGIWVLQGLL
jgi:hypothetical protein